MYKVQQIYPELAETLPLLAKARYVAHIVRATENLERMRIKRYDGTATSSGRFAQRTDDVLMSQMNAIKIA
jgi:hypothetical protein